MKENNVITIDGPVASGKGSVAVCVAKALGWNLLESGVLYRSLVVLAEHRKVDLADEDTLAALVTELDLCFSMQAEFNLPRVFLGENEISAIVRSEMCGNLASKISQCPKVRAALLMRQRQQVAAPGLVAEGRDMGTVIFPDAQYKFYLDASAECRAQRRKLQLQRNNIEVEYEPLLQEIRARDERDKSRTLSPLKPAEDAKVIDTSELSIKQVCDLIVRCIKE